MEFLKLKATRIFNGHYYLPDNSVLIVNKDGSIEDIVAEKEAGEDIKYFDGIIAPGFVNCHCHLELSHLKNKIEEGSGLVKFLIRVVKARNAESDEIETALAEAISDSYESGTVAIGDISNTDISIQIKRQQKLKYYNFLEVLGFNADSAQKVFDHSVALFRQFKDALPRSKTSIVPHAPYSVSKKLFELINQVSKGKTISVHNQETKAEAILYHNGISDFDRLYTAFNIDRSSFIPSRKSSIRTYLPYLKDAKNILLIHNTFTEEEDLTFADGFQQQGFRDLFWCICVRANLYIESRLPPLEKICKRAGKIVLGTDSYASNKTLNMLDEMKQIQKSFPWVSLETILKWATTNGAEALQMQNEIGVIEKGKQPGIVFIDLIENGKLTKRSAAKRLI